MSDNTESKIDIPREHRIEAKPIGDIKLSSVSEDGTELDWERDVGKHHYTCSCGERFEGSGKQRQIIDHLIDEGVLDWDDVDYEDIR